MNDPTISAQRSLPLLSEVDRDLIVGAAFDCERFLLLADQPFNANFVPEFVESCRRRASGEAMFAFAVAEGRV